MREIKFRGKRSDNGEWVECGTLIHLSGTDEQFFYMPKIGDNAHIGTDKTGNVVCIPECNFYRIVPETVGQYTGQDAIGNVPIFEGDIVWNDEEDERAVISWDKDESKFVIEYEGWFADFSNTYGFELEVIGNIHDNPELIGGNGNDT